MKKRSRKAVSPTMNGRKLSPLKIDPTRTITLRRQFAARIKRQFGLLKGKIVKLLLEEDAFGLKESSHDPYSLHPSLNVFCATGDGGGVDPSCSPWSASTAQAASSPASDPRGDRGPYIKHPFAVDNSPKTRAALEKVMAKGTRTSGTVDLSKLTATQEAVRKNSVKFMAKEIGKENSAHTYIKEKLIVVEHGGKQYLYDGTHRASALRQNGETHAEAVIYRAKGAKPVRNAFCPTGEGGGVDPTCSPVKAPGPELLAEVAEHGDRFEKAQPDAQKLGADGHGLGVARKQVYFGSMRSYDINRALRHGFNEKTAEDLTKDQRLQLERAKSGGGYRTLTKKDHKEIDEKLEEWKKTELSKRLKEQDKDNAKIKERIDRVREEFDKTPLRANGETVYRGTNEKALGDVKIGDTFSDKGFFSSTMSFSHAHNWAPKDYISKTDKSTHGVVLRIKTPRDEPVLYHRAEAELLFRENTKFKVTGVTQHKQLKVVDVEMLPREQTRNALVANTHHVVDLDEGMYPEDRDGLPSVNYSPDQPRDEHGRFTSSGDAGTLEMSSASGKELIHKSAMDAVRGMRKKIGGSISSFLGKVPGGAFVKGKLAGFKEGLESRYGKHTALAIVGTANAISWGAFVAGPVIGYPNYIPATGLMLAGAALAEGYLQGRRAVGAVKSRLTKNATEVELPASELQREARNLYHAILEEASNVTRTGSRVHGGGVHPAVLHSRSSEGVAGEQVANTRWKFSSSPEKVRAFQAWLSQQLDISIRSQSEEEMWKRYAEAGFRKGAGRAFDDVRGNKDASSAFGDPGKMDFYAGTKDEFLRSAFAKPVAVEKVKLLAGRSFDDLENVTEDLSARLSRSLTDGLVQGQSPREIAREMSDDLDLSQDRALLIARTEIIRAHAEGQLTALKDLGVTKLGVMVEWSTTGDEKVCPDCEAFGGTIYDIDDASGLIPAHPNCRCAWVPANVGEDEKEPVELDETTENALTEFSRVLNRSLR